jgi:N utilization substance protein B
MKTNKDPRHEARRVALATLFGWSFLSEDNNQLLDLAKEEVGEKFDKGLAKSIIDGVKENLKKIDQIIRDAAPEWPLDQIARVDLICLRIAVFELDIAKEVPHKVAIDEAIELAKEFGSEQSGKFVNGVLGTIVKTLMPEKG